MLIRADISSDKTNLLIRKYIEFLSLGAEPYEILFLVQNAYKKKLVTDYLKSVKIDFSPVTTFGGLIYNTINEKWKEVLPIIKIGETKEKPNLCSMELSQYIMKRCIDEVGFKDYFSKVNLLHQLFRRYYLIQQNELSNEEIKKRSKILGETWGEEAQKVLKKFEEKTLEHKCFDYLRQMPIFKYIYNNTNQFEKIKYILLDDGDEITQFELNFIKYLAPQLKDYCICYDNKGASRSGYLSAKKNIEQDFIQIFNEKPIVLNSENKNAEGFYKNLIGEKTKIHNFETTNFLTRLQMINAVCEKINNLIKKGAKINEIAIIAPEIDFALENFLKKYIDENNFEFLSGNKKLVQDNEVRNFLTVIKLANPDWNLKIEQFEINSLLNNFLKIPLKYCQKIITEFKKSNRLEFFEFENKIYENNYKKIIELTEKIKILSLSDAIIEIQKIKGNSEKINFLLKQILEFETLFEKNKLNKNLQKTIIRQFENSMIAENSTEKEINTKKIIVSTPQKFIDISKKVKYQFWLDLSSPLWLVEDIGNIYNAWGFQSDIKELSNSYEDLLKLTKDKTGRILRKLALLADNIYGYSSCYDSSGYENQNGILEFLTVEDTNAEKNITKKIEPRDDQKPVLNYKKGKMGIAAVPGAGKTTILLLLIIKLLTQQKISPENIYVLTYMDSASKHFKEKLMEFLPNLKTLPNISTIHGLCLKILKDNSNYVRVNLDPDFQVCDELNRKSFIYGALIKTNLKEDDFSKYEKALSMAKLNPDIDLTVKDKSLFQFKKFFENYNKILYQNSMIDYDDMIYYAVKLLEENPDILSEYQQTCQYIIEDEAQDSSLIQNRLLNLLSGKHNNLIRCGDPNQAITTTFTNADTKGFQQFIDNNNVKMSSSQRCSAPIYTLANKLIENYPKSFYKNIIKGTAFNPKNTEKVSFKEFEIDNDERNYILNEIKKIFTTDKNASVAILLRNNYQVENYMEFLKNNEIKTVEKTECLKNNRVYKVIYAFFEMLEFPYNNKILSEGLKKLCNEKLYVCKEGDFEKLKNLKTSFLTVNPDDLDSYELSKFWWDFDYIYSKSNNGFDYLITTISDYYFNDQTEIENAFMLAQIARKFSNNTNNEQTFFEKFKALKNLFNIGTVKFLKNENKVMTQNSVQIMTIHKSKGDEFDYVFVPEMSDRLFSLNSDNIKISTENHFCECLKPKEKRRSVDEMKTEHLNETLHLIYVAITRAKKRLYLSYSKNIKKGLKKLNCCEIFVECGGFLTKKEN